MRILTNRNWYEDTSFNVDPALRRRNLSVPHRRPQAGAARVARSRPSPKTAARAAAPARSRRTAAPLIGMCRYARI